MKNLFLITIVFAAFSLSACGQKENVPEKVITSFEQKFPDAKKVKWEKENDTHWEAEFKLNGKEYSSNFDNKGNWLETDYEVEINDIPAAVKSTLDNEFLGFEIEEAEVLETAEGTVYKFEIEKDETEMEVVIDPSGKVVKKEIEAEKDGNNSDDDDGDDEAEDEAEDEDED